VKGSGVSGAILAIAAALSISAVPAYAAAPAPQTTCPLTLVSFALGGKSVSGREAMYRLDATVTGDATSATVLLAETHGATTLSWPEIVGVDTATARKATLWFTQPAARTFTTAMLSSVVVDGTRERCAPIALPISDSAGQLTVYDDSHPHVDLAEPQTVRLGQPLIDDSSFAFKQPTKYPDKAVELGIQGDITVGIQIGADGTPQFAWVVSRFTTDMSKELDGAALYAALHSKYVPYMVDGVAQPKRYRIIYTFKIDMPDESTQLSAPADDHALCPLLLDAIRLKNEDSQDANAWY